MHASNDVGTTPARSAVSPWLMLVAGALLSSALGVAGFTLRALGDHVIEAKEHWARGEERERVLRVDVDELRAAGKDLPSRREIDQLRSEIAGLRGDLQGLRDRLPRSSR